MTVTSNDNNIIIDIGIIIIALVSTIGTEIIISLMMGIKNIKTIFISNLITNIILQLSLIYIPITYIITFVIMEILIIDRKSVV